MKFVAFDYGVKRVGIAASDEDGKWAFPVRTLDRTLKSAFYAELADLLGGMNSLLVTLYQLVWLIPTMITSRVFIR